MLQYFEHPAAVLDVAWINESLAASACLDRRVRLLNVENGQMVIPVSYTHLTLPTIYSV